MNESLKREMSDNGFVVLNDVVPPEKLAEFKALVEADAKSPNYNQTRAMNEMISTFRVQERVREVLGDNIFFLGWGGITFSQKARVHHYHDDAKGVRISREDSVVKALYSQERDFRRTDDEEWPIYRLFIYLNDHKRHSGGTKVRKRSHRLASLFSREAVKTLLKFRFSKVMFLPFGYVNPYVGPGDAVLFNCATKHAGHFVRLRGPLKHLALPTFVDNWLKGIFLRTSWLQKIFALFTYPFPKTRTTVSIDFCYDSDWSRGYQLNRLSYRSNAPKISQLLVCTEDSFIEKMRQDGVPVLDNPVLKKIRTMHQGAMPTGPGVENVHNC